MIGNLFWIALGMALMFGAWFGAMSLWKGVTVAAQWTANIWGGAAKAMQADVAAIKADVALIKTHVVPPTTASTPAGGVV